MLRVRDSHWNTARPPGIWLGPLSMPAFHRNGESFLTSRSGSSSACLKGENPSSGCVMNDKGMERLATSHETEAANKPTASSRKTKCGMCLARKSFAR